MFSWRMHEMFEPQQQHLGRYNGIKCKWSTALATRTMSACPNTQQQQQQQQLSVVQPALVKHQQWQQLKKNRKLWKVSCFKWHQSRVQIRFLFCVMIQSWYHHHHHHLAESIMLLLFSFVHLHKHQLWNVKNVHVFFTSCLLHFQCRWKSCHNEAQALA